MKNIFFIFIKREGRGVIRCFTHQIMGNLQHIYTYIYLWIYVYILINKEISRDIIYQNLIQYMNLLMSTIYDVYIRDIFKPRTLEYSDINAIICK